MYINEAVEVMMRCDTEIRRKGGYWHYITYLDKGQRVLCGSAISYTVLSVEDLMADDWEVKISYPYVKEVIRQVLSCRNCTNHKPRRRPRG